MARSTSTQDIVRWLLYGLTATLPALYSVGFESVFTMPKLTLLRVVTLIIVVVWGLQIVVEGRLTYRRSEINKWILMYGGVLALATLTSTYFWTSLFGDNSRFIGFATLANLLFLIFAILAFFDSKGAILRWVKVSVWTAVILSIYGLLQSKGWVGAEGWTQDPTFRVFGTMGHSNHFGSYLAFHVLLLAGLLFTSKRSSERALYVVSFVPMIATILATASRGAFFSLAIGLTIFAAGMIYRRWEWVKKQAKKIVLAAAVGAVLLGIFNQPIIERVSQLSLTQRTLSTIEFVRAGNVPDRVSWWFSGLAMVEDQPFLGHGVATFHDIYNLYRRTDYRVPGDIQDTFTPETAHMEYLDIAATQGILGLAIYLGLLLMWVRLLWRIMVSDESALNIKILALSFLSAGLVYLAQVAMSFGVIGTLFPMYSLIGISAALYHVTTDPAPPSGQFKRVNFKGLSTMGLSLFVSIIWIFSAWFTYRQAMAEVTLDTAEDYRSAGEVALMIDAYQSSTKQMPWMTRYWEAYGQATFDFSDDTTDTEIVDYLLKTSIGAYNNAYRLVQTLPHIQANLGIAYITYAELAETQGKNTEAASRLETGLHFYREATEVGMNNPLFKYNYALILISLNRCEEALPVLTETLTIRDPYSDSYYRIALCATELKDYETARTYIQKALAQDASNEDVKALLQRINSEAP